MATVFALYSISPPPTCHLPCTCLLLTAHLRNRSSPLPAYHAPLPTRLTFGGYFHTACPYFFYYYSLPEGQEETINKEPSTFFYMVWFMVLFWFPLLSVRLLPPTAVPSTIQFKTRDAALRARFAFHQHLLRARDISLWFSYVQHTHLDLVCGRCAAFRQNIVRTLRAICYLPVAQA